MNYQSDSEKKLTVTEWIVVTENKVYVYKKLEMEGRIIPPNFRTLRVVNEENDDEQFEDIGTPQSLQSPIPPRYQYVPNVEIAEAEEYSRESTKPFGRALESTQMETDEVGDGGGEEKKSQFPLDVDLTWSKLLEAQCPYLYAMIQKEDGGIDAASLDDVMRKLKLNPCNPNTGSAECLQRNCAILWRYYIQRKNGKNQNWKRCGSTLTDSEHFSPDCVQAQIIADHMFSERDSFSYRPGDISFLYDLASLESADKSKFGSVHKINKKRGDVILKINRKVHPGSIHGNNIIRYLLVNNQQLLDYFINIYSMEVGTDAIQPNRKMTASTNMYLLLESMDGSLTNFQQHFQVRDPFYWNRLNRMLCHALMGLYKLNRLGYAHNDVKKENTLYKLDWENNLTAIKFADYDCVGPIGTKPLCVTDRSLDPLTSSDVRVMDESMRYEGVDRFAFGVMVYEMLFGEHFVGKTIDKTWSGLYMQYNNPSSATIHNNIKKLLTPNDLQPISTVAYHFIVNDRLFPQEKRWNYEQAFEFIKNSDLSRDVLPPLPRHNQIPELPHPYLNW
jgi:hypothetical protein